MKIIVSETPIREEKYSFMQVRSVHQDQFSFIHEEDIRLLFKSNIFWKHWVQSKGEKKKLISIISILLLLIASLKCFT